MGRMAEITEKAKERYPLEPVPLTLAGRNWTILCTKLIFSLDDEMHYFHVVRLPYGVALWSGSLALADELADRAEELSGKSVLELGAGVGLTGLVAAHLGADVTQTDYHEVALRVCRLNAEVNGIGGLECRLADWLDFGDAKRYDYIIGSEILYDVAVQPALKRIFERNLAPGGHVIVADGLRRPSADFLGALEGEGWRVTATVRRVQRDEETREFGLFDLERVTGGKS